MTDKLNDGTAEKIRNHFGKHADWIVPALQNHRVFDDMTALDLVDLDDEELLSWIDETMFIKRHPQVGQKWETAHGLRENFQEPPKWFTEEIQHIVVALLEEMLNHANFEIQLCAAYVLSTRGAEAASAVPVLIAGLRKRDASIKYTAVVALGDIGPPAKEAIPKLQTIGNKSLDRPLRQAAWEAIKRIESRSG